MKLASAIAPAMFLAIGLVAVASVAAEEGSRDEKIFSFLNLVKIPNDVCAGTSRNGTCYLADECTERGGVASGTCGQGYGVCCVIELSCGGKSSDNNTHLIQSAKSTFTADERSCDYKICPQATDVTRIRFDFEVFVLNAPALATAVAAAVLTPAYLGTVGRCLTDSFALDGSPEICGTNTGQHMIVDSDGMNCVAVMFNIGSNTDVSRSWTIVATQYRAGEEDMSMAGPSGCLQYFTATTGSIKSFNFPDVDVDDEAVIADATHLANQRYDICIRRNTGNCQICYWPADPIAAGGVAAAADQGSFGVSVIDPLSGALMSAVDSSCSTDFLSITNGGLKGTATRDSNQKYCGRFFNTDSNTGAAHATICTSALPFTVGVTFDNVEVAVGTDGTDSEDGPVPSGSVGFSLFYNQERACTA